MTFKHKRVSERDQLDLFRALPGDLAPRDAQDLMAYPFFSLAKSKRVRPIDYRTRTVAIRVEAVPDHGMATIWDADVLIWAASQIVEARDAGLKTSRLMAATPYEILTFVGRGTGARDYDRLKAAFDRLQSTTVLTSIATQSLSDIDGSAIAPAIIESCPTRLFLPNERAIEPQITAIYRRFGLNDRQIEILARATPKRDYYCQSRRGNRLFELGLGEVALALTAASSKSDQALIEKILGEHGRDGFLAGWLSARGAAWAADLIPGLNIGEVS